LQDFSEIFYKKTTQIQGLGLGETWFEIRKREKGPVTWGGDVEGRKRGRNRSGEKKENIAPLRKAPALGQSCWNFREDNEGSQ